MDSNDEVEDVNLPQTDILQATSIYHWYPIFQKDTLKSIFLTLSPEFLKYLSLDGIVLPKSVFTTKFSSATETDESFDDWGSEDPEEDPPCPDFPEFVSQLQAVLDEWEVIVPRSNWGVPKDAEWITPTRSIKCTTVEDIFLLLKASPRLLHDFTSEPYCGAAPPILALRKWYDLNRSMEFRLFIVAKQLVGISQKHCGEYFAHLQSIQEGILTTILTFFEPKSRVVCRSTTTPSTCTSSRSAARRRIAPSSSPSDRSVSRMSPRACSVGGADAAAVRCPAVAHRPRPANLTKRRRLLCSASRPADCEFHRHVGRPQRRRGRPGDKRPRVIL
eukprot:TRINITY_DN9586_c0_g1_i1.p1 TRINITY_DN9586_c0_g1~~TRINITY_DN9586_c0_g1_i1.p1  ORF type:complete len:346 (+),score=0.90 TRINITY_DN9586_c0_g1_i1:43-1038(+)